MELTWQMHRSWTSSAGVTYETYRSNAVDHGLKDAKGRTIGGYIEIEPAYTYQQQQEGRYTRSVIVGADGWRVSIRSTRDGRDFGPLPPRTHVAALEEAKTLAVKRLLEQRKRFEKAVAKGEGRQFQTKGQRS